MWLAATVFTGFAAGGIHVVTGPDHVAAVAPPDIDPRSECWKAGLMWGIGHPMGGWVWGESRYPGGVSNALTFLRANGG